jgi:hypothetical protein
MRDVKKMRMHPGGSSVRRVRLRPAGSFVWPELQGEGAGPAEQFQPEDGAGECAGQQQRPADAPALLCRKVIREQESKADAKGCTSAKDERDLPARSFELLHAWRSSQGLASA